MKLSNKGLEKSIFLKKQIALAILVILLLCSILFLHSCKIKEPALEQKPLTTTQIQEGTQEAIQEETNLNEELFKKAASQLDSSICEEITDETIKIGCIDNVLLRKATEQNDESICAKISNEMLRINCKDTIVSTKASLEDDISSCEQITDTQQQEICKNNAIMREALKTKDKALCDKLTDEFMKTDCENILGT